MVNKVILLGNLGKDPEVRQLENNNKVARFPVATHENYKDKSGNWQEVTDWHTVVLWGPLAERAEKSLQKGSTVFIEGKLKTRKWTDNTGADRYTTEVVASILRLLDKRDQNRPELQENNKDDGDEHNPDENGLFNNDDQDTDELPF